jgi:small subunit ribosomal protein S4
MINQASTCERCRRAGEKIFLKGDKCFGPKCPMLKRNYPPGQHGPDQKHVKTSSYGKQLKEKQKAKRYYDIRERQFANYIAKATKRTGDSSKFLIENLEMRLDNVVYRLGLATSRASSRQMVSHGLVCVNGKKVNIPSYSLKVGQEVSISAAAKKKKLFEKIEEKLAKANVPSWLMVEPTKVTGKVLNSPVTEEVPYDPKAIIEFYSR